MVEIDLDPFRNNVENGWDRMIEWRHLEACSQIAASVTLMVVINRKLFVYCIRYLPNYRIT